MKIQYLTIRAVEKTSSSKEDKETGEIIVNTSSSVKGIVICMLFALIFGGVYKVTQIDVLQYVCGLFIAGAVLCISFLQRNFSIDEEDTAAEAGARLCNQN